MSIDKYSFMNEYSIPERMRGSITRYIEDRAIPGDFLQAVICNNLSEAVGRADDENIRNLPAYVNFFYNHAPFQCWGSSEKMVKWLGNKK
jgi:hypothetical protein